MSHQRDRTRSCFTAPAPHAIPCLGQRGRRALEYRRSSARRSERNAHSLTSGDVDHFCHAELHTCAGLK